MVDLPLWKIWKSDWEYYSQSMERHKSHVPNHQPDEITPLQGGVHAVISSCTAPQDIQGTQHEVGHHPGGWPKFGCQRRWWFEVWMSLLGGKPRKTACLEEWKLKRKQRCDTKLSSWAAGSGSWSQTMWAIHIMNIPSEFPSLHWLAWSRIMN